MRAGCQVGTKADELLQGAPRVPPSEVLPLPDTPDTPGWEVGEQAQASQPRLGLKVLERLHCCVCTSEQAMHKKCYPNQY